MKKPIVFGKYLLLERVNVGGMAEVFIAKAFGVEGFERILAIKRILPSMAEDEEFITMFIDEARISVQLNHANIVHILELGKYDQSFFIAMEYVSARDVRTLLERYRRRKEIMPTAQAVYIASKICEGLDYAHRKRDARGQELNIIHRDVTPQNILVSYDGEVKIIDFGIAKAANRSQKTQAGILKGKFGYMSPEQVRGQEIDRRSDIFAVGVILYEMLTGEKLFVGESDFSTLEKVRNADVPSPRGYNENIPPGLEQVLLKALTREPEDRYQWASDLEEDLMRFLLAGDTIYSAKHLGGFMKDAFAEDLAREAEKMERFASIERPGDIENSGVTASLSPGAGGVTIPPPRATGQRSAHAAAPQPLATADDWDDKTVIEPSVSDALESALSETHSGKRKIPVDDSRTNTNTNPFADEDTGPVSLSGPSGRRATQQRQPVIIGDGEAYSGATVVGPMPTRSSNPVLTALPAARGQTWVPPEGDDNATRARPVSREDNVIVLDSSEISLTPGPMAQLSELPDDSVNGLMAPPRPTRSGVSGPPMLFPAGDAHTQSVEQTESVDRTQSLVPEDLLTNTAPPPALAAAASGAGPGTDLGRVTLVAPSKLPAAPLADELPGNDAAASERPGPPVSGDTRPERTREREKRSGGRSARSGTASRGRSKEGTKVLFGLVGVGVAVFLAVLGGLTYWNSRTVDLMVLVFPEGQARVTVNGKPVQNNQLAHLRPGDYTVEASADGYRAQRIAVRLVRGQTHPPVSMMLDRDGPPVSNGPREALPSNTPGDEHGAQGPTTGTEPVPQASQGNPGSSAASPAHYAVRFSSEVSGVEVFVDGKSVGKTPDATRSELVVGKTYSVTARKPGYNTYATTFSSQKAGQITVSLRLEKTEREAGGPAVDLTQKQTSPGGSASSSNGSGTGGSSKVKGKLACSSNPAGAEIWVDSHNTGRQTPAALQNPLLLGVGPHLVVFKIGARKSEPQRVVISEKEVSKLVNVPVE